MPMPTNSELEHLWGNTWHVNILSVPTLTHLPRIEYLKRFVVYSEDYDSRHIPGFKSTAFFKLTLSGTGMLQVDKETIALRAGTGFLFSPTSNHDISFYYEEASKAPWQWLHCSFCGCNELVSEVINLIGPTVQLADNDPTLRPLWNHALSSMKETSITIDAGESARMATTFLTGLISHSRAESLPSRAQYLVEKAKLFIANNLHERPQVKTVANSLGISPEHLNRLFKSEVGISPLHFIQQETLRRATNLLQNPCIRIKQLANDLGFKSSAQFVAFFTRNIGMSPLRYRSNAAYSPFTKTLLRKGR